MTKKRSASEKAPAYQWYPKDYDADEAVCYMTYEQEGVYRRLLDRQWNEGSIPADPRKIAALVPKVPSDRFVAECWPAMADKFVPRPSDGRLINQRLERQRAVQEQFQEIGREGGRASAEARRLPALLAATVEPCEAVTVEPSTELSLDPPGHPPVSISDLQSSVQEDLERETREAPRYERPTVVTRTVDPAERAAAVRFVEKFSQLFTRYRSGATYHTRPAKDYEHALNLLKSFDVQRLEQLAVVFLNSDEPFISSTARGLGVFESRVTWCDEKLREAQAKAATGRRVLGAN